MNNYSLRKKIQKNCSFKEIFQEKFYFSETFSSFREQILTTEIFSEKIVVLGKFY